MNPSDTLRVLHFADAHIDIANYGRHDPETALPIRVMDFLRALDQVVDTAVDEQVDLVLFAGDAYKDRNPQPTFQREWGRRMMRLSAAGIPTLLLVGNHDVSPASGRAHTLHEFTTLNVPNIHVADRIQLWRPDQLGAPVQVLTVPWVSRSQLMTREEMAGLNAVQLLDAMEERVTRAILSGIETADPELPLILMAHASVQGAKYGSERGVMLGNELVLSGRIVNDRRLDYVALGHIHRYQQLQAAGSHPPVVYAGSIERIDFGEERETKGFILAEVGRGTARVDFRKLQTRPMLTFRPETHSADSFMDDILNELPEAAALDGAICRVMLTYPREWESLLDEKRILERFERALSVQIQKLRLLDRRARLGDTLAVDELSAMDLLETYWLTRDFSSQEIDVLQALARDIIVEVDTEQ